MSPPSSRPSDILENIKAMEYLRPPGVMEIIVTDLHTVKTITLEVEISDAMMRRKLRFRIRRSSFLTQQRIILQEKNLRQDIPCWLRNSRMCPLLHMCVVLNWYRRMMCQTIGFKTIILEKENAYNIE
ncbi:hypothetical protein Tco_1056025 [Tanacetum coccineum]|uniref:Uncharacterized protein n=1 Tax=Tanacetum coccineum TaxID=301880 RepID=A0ABQ5H3N4_9ASTR